MLCCVLVDTACAASTHSPCRGFDYIGTDPAIHFPEFMALCALANVDDDEFLAESTP